MGQKKKIVPEETERMNAFYLAYFIESTPGEEGQAEVVKREGQTHQTVTGPSRPFGHRRQFTLLPAEEDYHPVGFAEIPVGQDDTLRPV